MTAKQAIIVALIIILILVLLGVIPISTER
jgi:hypothetical protein